MPTEESYPSSLPEESWPPLIHASGQRVPPNIWEEDTRLHPLITSRERVIRCDHCHHWFYGNNAWSFVKKMPVAAIYRGYWWKKGRLDATAYCWSCLRKTGHAKLTQDMQRRMERKRQCQWNTPGRGW